ERFAPMKRVVFLSSSCLSLSLLTLLAHAVQSGDAGLSDKGLPGPSAGVRPAVTLPGPPGPAPRPARELEQPRPGAENEQGDVEVLKAIAPFLPTTGGREVQNDPAGFTPLAPGQTAGFNGLGQNGWIPYDAAIAVGPNHVLVMTNAQWAAYTKAG